MKYFFSLFVLFFLTVNSLFSQIRIIDSANTSKFPEIEFAIYNRNPVFLSSDSFKFTELINGNKVQSDSVSISRANDSIDYSKSNIRSDFLDIYLAYRCAFAFGDSSAWMTAPMAFRKHLAYANFIPFSHLHYYSNKFTYIFKYYFDEKLNNRLSINEIFERKLHYLYSNELKKNQIKIVDNSPEDILRLVLEVESKYTGKFKNDPENELLNKNFKFFLNNNAFLKKDLNKSFELKSSCEKNFLKNNFYTN